MNSRLLPLLFPVLLALAPALGAQEAPARDDGLRVGLRVRYLPPESGRRYETGTVRELRGDTAIVRTRGGFDRELAVSEAGPIQASAGNDRMAGAIHGMVGGTGAGALVGLMAGGLSDSGGGEDGGFYTAVAGGMLGGAVGLFAGILIGSERWIPVSSGARATVGAAPASEGGVAVGVTVSVP